MAHGLAKAIISLEKNRTLEHCQIWASIYLLICLYQIKLFASDTNLQLSSICIQYNGAEEPGKGFSQPFQLYQYFLQTPIVFNYSKS